METHRKVVLVELGREEVAQQSAALGCLPIHHYHAPFASFLQRLRSNLCSSSCTHPDLMEAIGKLVSALTTPFSICSLFHGLLAM